MKIRNLIVAAIAGICALVACTEKNPGSSSIPEIQISTSTLDFLETAGTKTLTVTASRDWKVEWDADWIAIEPNSGAASSEPQTVSVKVLENPDMERSADLKFTIEMQSKYLTVTQAGPGGSTEALVVYANNFDKTKAEKSSSGWKTYLDEFDGWLNVTGSGAETVTYGFQKMTARTNSGNGSAGSYSDYVELGASGMNYLWFGSAPTYFAVKNITLPEGKTDFTLSFGSERYQYSESGDIDNTFSWEEFKTYVSVNGSQWVRPEFTFAGGSLPNGRWDLATTTFTVPVGSTALYVYFAPTVGSAYAIDDLKLVQASAAGTVLDFTNGETFEVNDNTTGGNNTDELPDGTGEGTLESPYDAAKATKVASALADGETKTGVYVKGTVKSIKDASGIAQYGNISYYITDADGAANFYVFRGKYLDNTKFTSEDQLKVGDEVVVYGDLINYYGNTPELASGNYLVSLNGSTDGGNEGGGEGGETPIPPVGEAGEYDPQGVTWTLGASAYDNTLSGNNCQTATVNGVTVSNLLKLGTGSKVGDAILHVAAGTTKLGFYAVAWKNKSVTVKFSVDGTELTTISPAANAYATGNAPYTLTLADSDYYEVPLPAGATDIKVETIDPSNGRVLFIGLKAITE